MYKDFADIHGTYDEVTAKVNAIGLTVHVRPDNFIRKFGEMKYIITRVYVMSSEDYTTLVLSFPDTFILFRLSESSFVL